MSPPSRPQIEEELRRFIVEEVLEEGYDGRDPLSTQSVDSLGLEQLVDYIEGVYGVTLRDEDLVTENFESIPVLAAFVDSKLRGEAS